METKGETRGKGGLEECLSCGAEIPDHKTKICTACLAGPFCEECFTRHGQEARNNVTNA